MVKLGIYGTVYNSADTVRTTIEDLKKKLKYDFVISVCDNFSKDGTFEILKEYDFIDAFQRKSTRGLGRQYALENLIKNHPDVDYIFYIDFDVIFPDYLNELIKGIIKIYKENEIIGFGGFASLSTYKKILTKVRWRDMNVFEDFMYSIEILHRGFDLYFIGLPLSFNQERLKREKKYAKGLKYIDRLFKIYSRDYILHKLLATWIKFNSMRDPDTILYSYIKDILIPPELSLDKNLLFLIMPYHLRHLTKMINKLSKYYDYVYIYKVRRKSKGRYNLIIYYDYKTIEKHLLNFLKYNNKAFDPNKVIKINLK
ncbi:MAG: glycosyltransferase [Nanoarchaeota archaeon]|jgi:glycosyltransferase involved in cell wall biosynthesis|nr:glycosyltransferase [Nanoarchaeota archaeon]